MLTRLQIKGFKNLVDVDIRFGAFTCVAGANGVGKSNLFDAIRFLSALADKPLLEAAQTIRSDDEAGFDVRSLFHQVGQQFAPEMSFEAEMIIPAKGFDDLGQHAKATITFLRYSLSLIYKEDESFRSLGGLQITREELVHINLGDAHRHLLFPHRVKWRKSAVDGRRNTGSAFISTKFEDDRIIIKQHQDGGSSGKPRTFLASSLPRTVLSSTNAAESPTALLARREMQSWRLLQLEPSALRKPDRYTDPGELSVDGAHLPATIQRLARTANGQAETINIQVANRLSLLIGEVDRIWIDRDEGRQRLTLYLRQRDGTSLPAQALSDGTLRFLALAVLELDTTAQGIICLEEPENGISPRRIPAMLQLLQDIAVDTTEPVNDDNPLRQVIINTHSPAVVQQVPDDVLLIAELTENLRDGHRFKGARFGCLAGTWRAKDTTTPIIQKGQLLTYLNPVPRRDEHDQTTPMRVIDREDMQRLVLPFPETGD